MTVYRMGILFGGLMLQSILYPRFLLMRQTMDSRAAVLAVGMVLILIGTGLLIELIPISRMHFHPWTLGPLVVMGGIIFLQNFPLFWWKWSKINFFTSTLIDNMWITPIVSIGLGILLGKSLKNTNAS